MLKNVLYISWIDSLGPIRDSFMSSMVSSGPTSKTKLGTPFLSALKNLHYLSHYFVNYVYLSLLLTASSLRIVILFV